MRTKSRFVVEETLQRAHAGAGAFRDCARMTRHRQFDGAAARDREFVNQNVDQSPFSHAALVERARVHHATKEFLEQRRDLNHAPCPESETALS